MPSPPFHESEEAMEGPMRMFFKNISILQHSVYQLSSLTLVIIFHSRLKSTDELPHFAPPPSPPHRPPVAVVDLTNEDDDAPIPQRPRSPSPPHFFVRSFEMTRTKLFGHVLFLIFCTQFMNFHLTSKCHSIRFLL